MKQRVAFLRSYYVVLLVLLYIPLAVLFLFSINDGTALTFPMRVLTTHWYQDMFGNSALLTAVGNSATVAIISSTLASALGTAAAIALMRFKFRGKILFVAVALMPLLVPVLILGGLLLVLFAALELPRALGTVIS